MCVRARARMCHCDYILACINYMFPTQFLLAHLQGCVPLRLILSAAPMEAFRRVFQELLPQYLKSLPIPSTIGEIAALTVEQCLQLVPFTLFLVLVVCLFLVPLVLFFYVCRSCSKKKMPSSPSMNKAVDRTTPVVSAHGYYNLVYSVC